MRMRDVVLALWGLIMLMLNSGIAGDEAAVDFIDCAKPDASSRLVLKKVCARRDQSC